MFGQKLVALEDDVDEYGCVGEIVCGELSFSASSCEERSEERHRRREMHGRGRELLIRSEHMGWFNRCLRKCVHENVPRGARAGGLSSKNQRLTDCMCLALKPSSLLLLV